MGSVPVGSIREEEFRYRPYRTERIDTKDTDNMKDGWGKKIRTSCQRDGTSEYSSWKWEWHDHLATGEKVRSMNKQSLKGKK
jgi:hypothetical protein